MRDRERESSDFIIDFILSDAQLILDEAQKYENRATIRNLLKLY